MRHALAVIALVAATPALADTDVSALIRDRGLAGAEAELAAIADPTASDLFGLGGVRFLRGVERALQTRYQTGLSPAIGMLGVPLLRLPVPENPAPAPFDPATVTTLFTAALADMEGAVTALDAIGGEVAVRLNTADIWFDIDGNGSRGGGEDMASVVALGLGTQLPAITVNFDTADAAWLRAYAHLLAGVSETVLAFDPTTAIARVHDATAAMNAINAEAAEPWGTGLHVEIGPYVDYAAIVLTALQVRPDPARLAAARDHFLATVQDNRRFWTDVARETDDDAEWIPNKHQHSATGMVFPPDTGTMWLAVLDDAEAVLTGQALIPYWRLAGDAGIDLSAIIADPPEMDLIGLAQGGDLLPYVRHGRVMNANSLALFSAMIGGDAGLFMVMLN